MAKPSEWAQEIATELFTRGERTAISYEDRGDIALALEAARKEALEDALRWVDAIHEGKDGSRDPAVVDNTCSRIKHTIRALIDKPPAPPADGKAVAAAMNEVAKRGLRGRHDG